MTTKITGNLNERLGDISKAIKEFRDRRLLNLVGNKIRDIIYKRVKSGYGVTDDKEFGQSNKQKLKPLSKSYQQQRAGKVFFFKRDGKIYKIDLPQDNFKPKKVGTGDFFSAKRSNLTYTGQLLDSIRVSVIGNNRVRVDIPDTKRDDGLTNKKVAEYVGQARPFFNITEGEMRIIDKLIKTELKKFLQSKAKLNSSQLRGF